MTNRQTDPFFLTGIVEYSKAGWCNCCLENKISQQIRFRLKKRTTIRANPNLIFPVLFQCWIFWSTRHPFLNVPQGSQNAFADPVCFETSIYSVSKFCSNLVLMLLERRFLVFFMSETHDKIPDGNYGNGQTALELWIFN